jgi:hypothetical protein
MTLARLFVFAIIFQYLIFSPFTTSGRNAHAWGIKGVVNRSKIESSETRTTSDALSHYIMGAVYDNFGDTSAAITEYEKALKSRNSESEIYMKLGADVLHGFCLVV